MAQAPVLGQYGTRKCWAGGVGEVPPWMTDSHTAQAGQYGIEEAHTTRCVGTGRAGRVDLVHPYICRMCVWILWVLWVGAVHFDLVEVETGGVGRWG